MVRCSNGNAGHQQPRRSPRTLPRALCDTAAHLPLCRHQVPRLRANSCHIHQEQVPGDPYTQTAQRLPRWNNIRLLHLPPRSNPSPSRLRNKTRLTLLSLQYLQTNLFRKASSLSFLRHAITKRVFFNLRPCCYIHNDNSDPSLRPRKLLPRLLPNSVGHASLRRHVLPHARHCRGLAPAPQPGSLHHSSQLELFHAAHLIIVTSLSI